MNTATHLTEKESGLLESLINDYNKDPNCWPSLWIASEDVSPAIKQAFIKSTLN